MKRRYFRPETLDGDLDRTKASAAIELGAEIDEDRCELFITEDMDPLDFVGLFGAGSVPPLEHERVLKRSGNIIWLRRTAKQKAINSGVTLAGEDIYLNCPKSEEADCEAEGGMWDSHKKQWFVPEGVAIAPFLQWIADG